MKFSKLVSFKTILAAVFLWTGCLFDSNEGDTSQSGKVIVLTSDDETGYLISFNLEESSFGGDTLPVYQDAVIRQHGDYVYVLERLGRDNILKVDPADLSVGGVIYQQHLKENANPTDLLIYSSDKGYVTPENDSAIYVIDPGTGLIQKEIATGAYIYQPPAHSGFAAASPHATAMVEREGMIYVLLQRLDALRNPGPPQLLKVDPEKDSIVGTIDLLGLNPQNMVLSGNHIYLSAVGEAWGSTGQDGGIEKLDLESGISEMVVSEADLGGDATFISHKSGDIIYVVVQKSFGDAPVVQIDAGSGEILGTLPGIGDAWGAGLFYSQEHNLLLVGDRGTPSGIRIFDEAGNEVGGPFSPGLPPAGILVLP